MRTRNAINQFTKKKILHVLLFCLLLIFISSVIGFLSLEKITFSISNENGSLPVEARIKVKVLSLPKRLKIDLGYLTLPKSFTTFYYPSGYNLEYIVEKEGKDPINGIIGVKEGKNNVNATFLDESYAEMFQRTKDVIFQHKDIWVKLIEGVLYLSENSGSSYKKSLVVSEVGLIRMIYAFEDGSLIFGTHSKLYYSSDWINYFESNVTDSTGKPFVPENEFDNFSYYNISDQRMIIGEKEYFLWGSYSLSTDSEYSNVNIWFTKDKGENVRSVYKFREDKFDDHSDNWYTRHIHSIDFNPADITFWISTGDYTTDGIDEAMVIQAFYDTDLESFTFDKIGADDQVFRFGKMVFTDNYIYAAWDSHTGGGIKKIPYNNVEDKTTHEELAGYKNKVPMLASNNKGELIAVLSRYTSYDSPNTIFYSSDFGITWIKVKVTMPQNITGRFYLQHHHTGNENGLLIGIHNLDNHPEIKDWTRLPKIDLLRFVREQVNVNAFK